MKRQDFVEAGREGAKKRWSVRYDLLKNLSAHFDKEQNNKFLHWKTEHLKTLWTYVGSIRNGTSDTK